MKNIYYFIYCSLILLATSCDYDERLSDNSQNKDTIKIVANMPNKGENTKVSFNDNETDRVLYVDWKNSGEKISVLRNGHNETFEQTSTTEDANNVFEGTNPNPDGSGLFYAIYPYNNQATNINAIPYDLSEQTGKLDETQTYMYASAEEITDGTVFNFRQLTAIIKPNFNLKEGEKIQSAIITLPENVYSKGTVNLSDQTYASDNDNRRTINISANNGEQLYIYVPAFQVSETVNINFELYTTHGSYAATKTVAKNIYSGVLYETEIELTQLPLSSAYVWINGIEAVTPEGDGSEETPYLISTAKHLQWFLNNVNDNTKASINKYYKLMHNLVINSSSINPWTPIGNDNDDHKFYGNFDGNGYVISGTLISIYSGEAETYNNNHVDFGFFGYLGNNSNVKNLILNLNVTGGNSNKANPNSGSDKHSNTGVLAGKNFEGTIENCVVMGNVKGGRGNNARNISHTGGIVGWNTGTVKNCTNMSNVKGGYGSNSSFTGGITGRCGNENSYDPGYMEGCVNKGTIEGGSKGNAADCDNLVSTGGIAGIIKKGYIKNSSNYGTISGNNDKYAGIVGCLKGPNYAMVYSCNQDYAGVFEYIIGNYGEEQNGTLISETTCETNHNL